MPAISGSPASNSNTPVYRATATKTTNASNTTASVPLFRVSGTILVLRLWGVVATALGANHTAASFRVNDQAAQVYLTLLAGTALSASVTGCILAKLGLVGAALTKIDSAAGAVQEANTVNQPTFQEFIITPKTGAVNTEIEYRYSTTDAPTSGAIQFFMDWSPMTDGASVTPQ